MKKIDFSKIYSYSKLNLFEKCPQQYYFNYLDPEIAPIKKQFIKPRDYKTKGQAVHGAITLFYHLPESEQTFEGLKKCLSKAWFSELNLSQGMPLGKLGGFRDLDHERTSYAQVLIMLKKFFDIEDPNPALFYIPTKQIKDSFCDYEEMIKPLNNKFSISGKFDRIDKLENNTLRIIDFKTSKNESNKFQLIFYKLLAELNFQRPVRIVSFYYLNRGEIVDFNVLKMNQNQIKDEVLKKIDKIQQTKDFLPQKNKYCYHCDFLEICKTQLNKKNKTLLKK